MNYILKAITDHPEAFEVNLPNEASNDELLQIIYSAKQLGTSIQQNSMTITKLYFGWTVLVKLGLREIAMPMGVQLLQSYNWNNHYQFAADICNQLMKHYYMLGNKFEAEKYIKLFKEYRDVYDLEAEMESLYCNIIYQNDHGFEIDKPSIIKDLIELESRLKIDSCKYHFYYFQCQSIINEGLEHEKWCLKGLAYFKNLYFKHEIYYNVFIHKLFTHYLNVEEYVKAKTQIVEYIDETKTGSISWYRLKYILIIALWNSASINEASKEITYCQSLKKYKNLSVAHQEEWEYLAKTIHDKIPSKIKVSKKK